MNTRALIFLCVTFLSLTSFAATADWWEDASLYQIYPRSWKDSDGNGVGDLKGITEKLDYLREIGITATWLSPIFKSPMADNGYDISDFYDVDPVFGNLEDFDALIKKAKAIGVKIILDFVPNHSSNESEWFQKSINREDGYEDFYVWADGHDDPQNPGQKLPPSNWISIFRGSMWKWNEKRQQFYLHQFLEQQPDFNFRNPKVRATMIDVLKFWLDRGVDGFRIDAVPHMYEKVNDDGSYPDEPYFGFMNFSYSSDGLHHIYTQHQYETVELLYEWRAFLDNYQKQNGGDTRILLAEAYSPIKVIDQYCGNATHNGVHLPFNFNFMFFNETTTALGVEKGVHNWMDVIWTKHQAANWVMGNHDNPRIVTRCGSHKKDLYNIILAALPGATVTYYGEEIGMSNVETCKGCDYSESRNFERSPFQWNDGISAGFSTSEHTWLPVAPDYKQVNVKVQRGTSRSTLNVFKQLHKLKHTKAFKAFKEQGAFSYRALNEQVFEVVRSSSTEEYRVLANLGNNIEFIGKLLKSGDFGGLMEYTLVTSNSPHSVGAMVKLSEVYLMPYEAVILKRVIRK